MLITIALAALFALAALRWFASQGGGSGPGLKPVDLVVLAGIAVVCWLAYLVANAALVLLIALAFAVGVELYIRRCRRRWFDADIQPTHQIEPARPVVVARRIAEPERVARAQPRSLPAPARRRALARPKP